MMMPGGNTHPSLGDRGMDMQTLETFSVRGYRAWYPLYEGEIPTILLSLPGCPVDGISVSRRRVGEYIHVTLTAISREMAAVDAMPFDEWYEPAPPPHIP